VKWHRNDTIDLDFHALPAFDKQVGQGDRDLPAIRILQSVHSLSKQAAMWADDPESVQGGINAGQRTTLFAGVDTSRLRAKREVAPPATRSFKAFYLGQAAGT
jgi:hypothetical protein